MARTFRDPQEELEFIGQVEEELERLHGEGVLAREPVDNVHTHYDARRDELAAALSGGGRIFSAETIAKRGTVSWVAWIGVVIVVMAALVFAQQGWYMLARPGRLAILGGFTAAFSAAAWYLIARADMRRTGLAVLSLAEGLLLITIAYAIDLYGFVGYGGIGVADTTAILAFGTLLFGFTAWKLDEPWMYYIASALAVATTQSGIEWAYYHWQDSLMVTYDWNDTEWRRLTYSRGLVSLAVNTLGATALLVAGWLHARQSDWRHANPQVFSGTLWLIGSFVAIEGILIPGDADGWLGLIVALGFLWLGLARQKKAIAIAATIGFAAALTRVEGEYFTSFITRSATLTVLGVALIVMAVLFERRRKEILGKLGEWQ